MNQAPNTQSGSFGDLPNFTLARPANGTFKTELVGGAAPMEITDRMILVGLIEAVGALAKRLTGDEMSIRIRDDDGQFVNVKPSGSVKWITASPIQSAAQAESAQTIPERTSPPDDSQ